MNRVKVILRYYRYLQFDRRLVRVAHLGRRLVLVAQWGWCLVRVAHWGRRLVRVVHLVAVVAVHFGERLTQQELALLVMLSFSEKRET